MTHDPSYENDYGALTLVNGTVYVPYSGNCDTNPYHGFVAAIRVSDGRRIATWFPSGSLYGGSIWGFGGVSADPGGAIFAAVGNSQGRNEHAGYGENVVKLTPGLGVISANYPGLPKGDADFGATPLLFQRPGCPPELAVGNKYGSFYVYDRDRISSGPVQQIGLGGSPFGQNGLLGVAAYWPRAATVFVSNPLSRGRYRHGMLAFRVTGSCRLSFAWSASDGRDGDASSPTVAAGVVFYGDGYGHKALALDARTGRLLWDSGRAIRGSVYAGPTVVNGKVYVSSVGGYLYAFAPAPQTVSPPSISGRATQSRTLTESHGSWTNNPKRYGYQWEACDSSGRSCAAIGGATRRKYTLTGADVGHTIRVQETATNASGASSPASLGGDASCLAAPTVEHRAAVDLWEHDPGTDPDRAPRDLDQLPDQLRLSVGAMRQLRWQLLGDRRRDRADVHADRRGRGCTRCASRRLRATPTEAGARRSRLRPESYSPRPHRRSTHLEQLVSSDLGHHHGRADADRLDGPWSGAPPISFSYQWERCAGSCSPIAGATSSRYTLTGADIGDRIALVVTATNSAGTPTQRPLRLVQSSPPGRRRTRSRQALVEGAEAIGQGEHRPAAQERRRHGRLLGAQPRPAHDRLVPAAEGSATNVCGSRPRT